MSFIARLQRAREILAQERRLSTRALERELEIGGDELDELIEELVDVQQVARREGKILVWAGDPGAGSSDVMPARERRPPTASPPAGTEEARKVVTIVFADLIGSTALHEQLDAESVTRLMERYYRAMRGAVEAHGGTVVKLMGDGVMAAFGVPRVAEDDAIRAVHAGMAMQEAFRELAHRELAAVGAIGLRVGINTGEVVVGADNTDIVGDPVNVAARLQAEAQEGQVVIGESTRRLVAARVTLAPLGRFALKGRAEAIKAYRVESLDPAPFTTAAAFVGRDDELARLMAVYDAAVATPAARLAILLGSPGLGKSRLIEEITRRLGDAASVVTAHCDAAGGATFAPVAAALRAFFQIEAGASPQAMQATIEAAMPAADAERSRIAGGIAALLAGSPASPEETFFVIRRLLSGLAQTKPVVLVIDDLQWAEPLLFDLVEHLVQWGSGTPLLVLLGARPELGELRSSLVTPGGLVSDVVTLSGLDAGAAMRLAASVIGAADLPAAVAAKVLATSEGNPLFVGELVRMLVDEGAIERQGERWIVGANLAALEMPPTIHALLAARIERLKPEERSVLERAAVVGRHFSRSAVAALLGRNGTELDTRLEALRRRELIERDTGWFLGEPVLRFHHVLIRDAAYRRLLKGTRAELHECLADWIEAQVKDAPEHDETIGWHLEQAHQHRRELGPLDAQGRALGERAAQRLAAAGRRALERDDVPLAASLLGRAIDRLDRDDPARAELALDWCEALLAAGDVGAAAAAIAELGRFAGTNDRTDRSDRSEPSDAQTSRLRAWHTCFTGQHTVLTAPEALHATGAAVATAAEELASLGDAAGEAKGHFVHALALARLGRVGACEAALDRALAAARRADDRRRANTVLAIAPLAALWGPSPVTRASGRCLDVVRVLRITQGAPAVEAVALSCQAVLEALRGRTEAARRMIGSARKMVEDLGITQRLLEADVFGGLIDLFEGDAAAAERNLRRAYDGLRDLGLGIDAAHAAALFARALLAQDRGAEAEALSHESEALAGDDLKAAIAWRGVRAEALARRGEHAAAVELASKAVEIAAATDALLDHADARLALAAALRAAGHSREADAEERRAIELWEAKGATLLVERARRTDAPAAAAVAAPEPRSTPVMRRRITSNGATEATVADNAAIAAHDFAALRERMSEAFEEIDHPTGSSYGRDAIVASMERLMRSRDASCRFEPLATLGDSLVLRRRRVHASATGGGRFDVGEYEQEAFQVLEVDERGCELLGEVFADNHLGDAIARLYERYAELLPEGPERERAAATARSVAVWNGPIDPDRLATTVTPSMEMVDHRNLGTWSTRGAEFVDHTRLQTELAIGFTGRTDGVLALASDTLLVRCTYFGIARDSGGAFENVLLQLFAFGADGLIARSELWEPDLDAEALARLDELSGGDTDAAANWFENAAARTDRELFERFNARDWAGVEALAAPELVFDERRRLVRNTCGRDVWLEQFRVLYDVPASRFTTKLLATRGERLSLHLHRFTGEVAGGGGPLALDDHLVLCEVDGAGRIVALVLFDLEDQDAAYDELEARFEAGEVAAHLPSWKSMRELVLAVASHDWDAVVALCADDLVEYDHRSLAVIGTTRGAEAWVQNFRTLAGLSPDTFYRVDHFRTGARGYYTHGGWHGTREGGPYEIPLNAVIELDAQGRIVRADIYDDDRGEVALARLAELAGPVAWPQRFANAATRAVERATAALGVRDLEGFGALHAPEFRNFDRRAIFRIDYDREQFLVAYRQIFEMTSSRPPPQVLATRGDRLVLTRVLWQGAGGDIGPSEIDWLLIIEVNGRGEHVAIVTFDPDDLYAAYAELDARWAAHAAAEHPRAARWLAGYLHAFAVRDWAAMSALFTPDLVGENHRLVGWGTRHGPEGVVSTLQAQIELAPDTQERVDHVRTCDGAVLLEYAWLGTREGGAFENVWLVLVELAPDGRARRADVWEPEQLDAALARFAELRPARTT